MTKPMIEITQPGIRISMYDETVDITAEEFSALAELLKAYLHNPEDIDDYMSADYVHLLNDVLYDSIICILDML